MDKALREKLAKKTKGIGAAAIAVAVSSALTIIAGLMETKELGFPLIMSGILGITACLGLSLTYGVLRDLFESDKP